jgi:hypothetical protein
MAASAVLMLTVPETEEGVATPAWFSACPVASEAAAPTALSALKAAKAGAEKTISKDTNIIISVFILFILFSLVVVVQAPVFWHGSNKIF